MRQLTLVILFLACVQQSKSQEFETILLAAEDASLLSRNYLNPAVKGLMYSMNGGWFTTAKTHKTFGFDLTISANGSFVPSKDELFDFIPSEYTFLTLPNGEAELNTVLSDNGTETEVDISIPNGDGTFKIANFDMPGGVADELPLNAVPAPMVQLGFGLPFKTDIKLRVVPRLNFDDSIEANLFGMGLQHDIMQYFDPLEHLPLNVSILAAFTTTKVSYRIEDDALDDNVAVTNGQVEFKMNTWTLQAIASLDFKVITLYGSTGYNAGTTAVKMKGDYTLTYAIEDANGTVLGTVNETISNPIRLDFEANGLRATIGSRINIGFFKIFADYTFQKYNTASAGIAFSFN